jgi:hypothetical protein
MTAHLAGELLEVSGARGVLLAASRDPDAKLTYLVPTGLPGRLRGAPVAVKIPVSAGAAAAVERERRVLVELGSMSLGALGETVPRCAGALQVGGRSALVATALPGTPMSVGYHQWRHTARADRVDDDFRLAGAWLSEFQRQTSTGSAPVTWAADAGESLRARWGDDPSLAVVLGHLRAAQRDFAGCLAHTTAVHGDYWFGNLLVHHGELSGVIDWENGSSAGLPLCDLARFALSYSLYLDRHTRPGHRVPGHPRLRRLGFAPGIRYTLLDHGWMPATVRSFLREGLVRLGLSPSLWYDVALVGIAEVAATANDDEFGRSHLRLLAELPRPHPEGGPRR